MISIYQTLTAYAFRLLERKRTIWKSLILREKIINATFYYNESRPSKYMTRKIQSAFIRMHMEDKQKPYAGATVRRIFKEIETKLIREAAR